MRVKVKEVYRRNKQHAIRIERFVARRLNNSQKKKKKDTDNGGTIKLQCDILHLIISATGPPGALVHWVIFHDIPWVI